MYVHSNPYIARPSLSTRKILWIEISHYKVCRIKAIHFIELQISVKIQGTLLWLNLFTYKQEIKVVMFYVLNKNTQPKNNYYTIFHH